MGILDSFIKNTKKIYQRDTTDRDAYLASKGKQWNGGLLNPIVDATKQGGGSRGNNLQLSDYNYNDIYNQLYKSYSSGGGGYTPAKADISGILAALENEASSLRGIASSNYEQSKKTAQGAYDLASKNARAALEAAFQNAQSAYDTSSETAKRSYETTRSDLLTSIKRFQEQNARDVQQQRQSYLTEQAALEAAREAANRQSRISSAARGLAGSGLQQLEQMQNLLNQGQQISELAGENQTVRENLARALAEAEEDNAANMARNQADYDEALSLAQTARDNSRRQAQTIYDTDINTAEATLADLLSQADSTYNNTLSQIASNLRTQRESRIADNEAAYTAAVNNARAQAASARSSAASNARNYANYFINNVSDIRDSLQDNLKNIQGMSNSEFTNYKKQLAANNGVDYNLYKKSTKSQIMQLLADDAKSNLSVLYQDPNLSLGNKTRNQLITDVNSLLKYYSQF